MFKKKNINIRLIPNIIATFAQYENKIILNRR